MTEKRFLVICDGFGEDSDVLIREDIDEWRYNLTPIYEKGEYNKAGINKIVNRLNELNFENKELKAKVDDKEVAVEVECEKLMQRVLDLIDEKIKELKNINNVSIVPRESIEALEQLRKEILE